MTRIARRGPAEDDGIILIPGEDLFFYATGRRPHFPVTLFDKTVDPYGPEEILKLARERGVRWLIVKKRLQLRQDPVQDRKRLMELLLRDFRPATDLTDYEIYERKAG